MKKAKKRKPVVLVEVENGVVVAIRVLNNRVRVLVVDWDAAAEDKELWADYIRAYILPHVEEEDPKTAAGLRRRLAAYVQQH